MTERDAHAIRDAAGSQRALRDANADRLLALLRSRSSPASQAELARSSTLSQATVSVAMRRLADAGLVRGADGVSGGRRSKLWRASPGRPVAGIDIGRTHVNVLVGTTAVPASEARAMLSTGHGPDDALPVLHECLQRAAKGAGLAIDDLSAVALGLPGPIDARRGVVTGGSILPAWVGVPVADMLRSELGAPVLLDNDANLGARAAALEHEVPDGTVVYVKVGSGVGAGIIVDGRPLRGNSGLAGEIGHMRATDGGSVCRCGRRGCLETLASADVVRSTLESILDRRVELDMVAELAQSGNHVVLRVLEGVGEAIGRCLADVCALLDPGMIVIGGPLASTGPALLDPIQHAFRRHALPGVAAATRMRSSTLGDRAEALGAMRLAQAHATSVQDR